MDLDQLEAPSSAKKRQREGVAQSLTAARLADALWRITYLLTHWGEGRRSRSDRATLMGIADELRAVAGETYREIGENTGRSGPAVRQSVYRNRKKGEKSEGGREKNE